MKKSKWIVIGIVIFLISITVTFLHSSNILVPEPQIVPSGMDKFGIDKIYPTKEGGREWFINMENPNDDSIFSITNNVPIIENDDGSWFINNSLIRMNVNTPPDDEQWKNIEMTGYVKARQIITGSTLISNNILDVDKIIEESKDSVVFDWRARGGRHNDDIPCEGTALNGAIFGDGISNWKKEIWHTGGYTDPRGTVQATGSIIDRWIGWKVVMYNTKDSQAVKMESYLDDENNNKWRKVTDIIDDGQWYSRSSDEVFYSAGCEKPKDYVLTNSGTIATFRADNIAFDFKDLSVREIQPPSN
ncbi:hypothetical protein BH23THE1_BH23THE1_21820 [soil metagenome]